MKIFKNKYKLKKEILNIKNISFVPTMGGLHKGHISLINRSKKFNGKTLVSIYINPKQFGDKKDFLNYPKNLKKDILILKKLKVNFVYIPNFKDIYSLKTKNKIFLHNLSKKLCGKTRKKHFEGVVNIVNRFLEIIKPKLIFLGSKDLQQIHIIKAHIDKRKINTKVIACKIIRENNGVVYSTRNKRLSKRQFKIASKIYKYLSKQKKFIMKNLSNFEYSKIKKHLINLGSTKIDYIEILNSDTLKKVKDRKENFRLFIAYYLGNIRLIDNI